MKKILLEDAADLDWLFDVYVLHGAAREVTKVAILHGNEDAPERIELYDVDDYRAKPFAVFVQDSSGHLVREAPPAVLDVPMQENDAGAATIRDYLKALLRTLWAEDEIFSGKRPFGNSGWKGELETALVKAGIVEGTFDKHGYLSQVDFGKADRLIRAAIEELK